MMQNRGCNQPVISHVNRKVCLADWGFVYLVIQLIRHHDDCAKKVKKKSTNAYGQPENCVAFQLFKDSSVNM